MYAVNYFPITAQALFLFHRTVWKVTVFKNVISICHTFVKNQLCHVWSKLVFFFCFFSYTLEVNWKKNSLWCCQETNFPALTPESPLQNAEYSYTKLHHIPDCTCLLNLFVWRVWHASPHVSCCHRNIKSQITHINIYFAAGTSVRAVLLQNINQHLMINYN